MMALGEWLVARQRGEREGQESLEVRSIKLISHSPRVKNWGKLLASALQYRIY
jgi:hypothetical protein